MTAVTLNLRRWPVGGGGQVNSRSSAAVIRPIDEHIA